MTNQPGQPGLRATAHDKARAFRALHTGGRPLVLPNAWDVASARVIQDAGAPAVATTSAGAAWGLGAPDGDRLGRDRAVELIARIVAAVDVPVSADIESGYGDGPEDVAATVREVIRAGAVGVNLEDAAHGAADGPLRSAPDQAARVAAARAAADEAGLALFLNARIDTYLFGVGEEEGRLKETIERASAYVEAGADGIFVPGVVHPDTVRELAQGITVPLNVMAVPGAPGVAEFAALGVARVSVGSGIAQAAHALVRSAARELLTDGTYETLAGGLGFGELNALLGRDR